MGYANRGMQLETEVEMTNEAYRKEGIACIEKIPTPVKVLRQMGNKITGFWEKKSTVDFSGVWKGRGICFDCKETKLKTRFDMKNIKEHQLKHMKHFEKAGGMAFLIVRFTKFNKTFIIKYSEIINYLNNSSRKSIPYSEFSKEVKQGKGMVLVDYLKSLEV